MNNIFSEIINSFALNVNEEYEDIILVLKKEELDKLEINCYEFIKDKYDIPECSICSDEFYDEDIIRILHCNHIFHRICIDKWLSTKSYKCILCRKECGESERYN
jgi:hypothetical protein